MGKNQFDCYWVLYHKKEDRFYTSQVDATVKVILIFLSRQDVVDFKKKVLSRPHEWTKLKIYFAQ